MRFRNDFTIGLLILCLFIPTDICAQNQLLNKKIELSKGKYTLKTALNKLSTQTSCVFSYDPIKINDKITVQISTNTNTTLDKVLRQILPKHIKYIVSGKYIVLQSNAVQQLGSLSSKTKGVEVDGVHKSNTLKFPTIKQSTATSLDSTTSKGLSSWKTADSIMNLSNLFNISRQKTVAEQNLNELSKIETDKKEKKTITKTEELPLKTENLYDSTNTIKSNVISIQEVKKDSVLSSQNTNITKSQTRGNKSKIIFKIGLSTNSKIVSLHTHVGAKSYYGIISFAKQQAITYRFGLGIGAAIKLNDYLGCNVELLNNRILNPISTRLGVKTNLVQFSTELNYKPSKTFSVYFSPNIYNLKSDYTSGNKTINLTDISGLGGVVGMRFDLINAFRRN